MDYKILTDTHTHTIASDHAYSTLMENVWHAKNIGLELLAMTDHAPDLMDAPHAYYFSNIRVIPRVVEGITILKGAEVNITDFDGSYDIHPDVVAKLELVIASMHEYVLEPGTVEQHDNTWMNIAKDPLIDVIGHSGQESFRYHYEEIIPLFKQYNKLVEINAHSPTARAGAYDNCVTIAKLCKKHRVPITVGSDSHFCFEIGALDMAKQILSEAEFPEDLIMSLNKDRLLRFLSEKKGMDLTK